MYACMHACMYECMYVSMYLFFNNADGKVAGRTARLGKGGRNVALTWRCGDSCATAKLPSKPHMLALGGVFRISHVLLPATSH